MMQHEDLRWRKVAAWDVAEVEVLGIIVRIIATDGVAAGDQLCVVEWLTLAEAVELQLLLERLLLALGAEITRVLQHLASSRLSVWDLHKGDIAVGHHVLLRHNAVSLRP